MKMQLKLNVLLAIKISFMYLSALSKVSLRYDTNIVCKSAFFLPSHWANEKKTREIKKGTLLKTRTANVKKS